MIKRRGEFRELYNVSRCQCGFWMLDSGCWILDDGGTSSASPKGESKRLTHPRYAVGFGEARRREGRKAEDRAWKFFYKPDGVAQDRRNG